MKWFCFKKLAPQNPVILPGNVKVPFGTVDNVWGYFATPNEKIGNALLDLVRRGEYGMSEVTEAEFREYSDKKKHGSNPPWREEFGQNNAAQLIAHAQPPASAAVVAATEKSAGPTPEPATVSTPATPEPTAPVKPPFNPPTGKRKNARASRSTPIQ